MNYILVLGHRLQNGKPSVILEERLKAAAACYREQTEGKIVVSGGITDGGVISEAECMRDCDKK